jgi:hypothetical protein
VKRKYLIIPLALLIFAMFVHSAKAAPGNNPVFATREWVEQRIQNLISILAQKEQESNDRFEALEARVEYLESLHASPSPSPTGTPSPTPTPTSTSIILADNRPASFEQEFIAPIGATSMTFNIQSTGTIVNWALLVKTPGSSSYHEQHRFTCGGGSCPVVTVPVLGSENKFSLGTSSGLINANVVINSDPSEVPLILGNTITLPYITDSFSTSGFTELIINAGQDNPQNLTGMELQKEVGGDWVTSASVSCDGGAECSYQILEVDGGNFRVKIYGSGGGVLLSALLR